ncbi:hypothetical protein SKAU_G00231350 [Synaphobranchus kaupii]|uniref:Uncharacterized protein n=1 Tax=Synaphobranchus kaupii TaxID=118154 RepID=A0A9Q1F642_SYNKA|nr:hypothetical protein SKAU_G00231350 [Synaphobranchus kaupii]
MLMSEPTLTCGDKLSKTEPYNCLSVDLVPGGSIQDSLALYFKFKEEGVSRRTRVGLHPYTCTIESNFEFELLSTRTCLSCGDKLSKTEPYNCLSVDLVPGGSIQDSLALYFKVCEVECQCHWCYGQFSSVEHKLQLLRRGNLVRLHDQLQVSPQLSLQAHSRANVCRPGMPKPHQRVLFPLQKQAPES